MPARASRRLAERFYTGESMVDEQASLDVRDYLGWWWLWAIGLLAGIAWGWLMGLGDNLPAAPLYKTELILGAASSEDARYYAGLLKAMSPDFTVIYEGGALWLSTIDNGPSGSKLIQTVGRLNSQWAIGQHEPVSILFNPTTRELPPAVPPAWWIRYVKGIAAAVVIAVTVSVLLEWLTEPIPQLRRLKLPAG